MKKLRPWGVSDLAIGRPGNQGRFTESMKEELNPIAWPCAHILLLTGQEWSSRLAEKRGAERARFLRSRI